VPGEGWAELRSLCSRAYAAGPRPVKPQAQRSGAGRAPNFGCPILGRRAVGFRLSCLELARCEERGAGGGLAAGFSSLRREVRLPAARAANRGQAAQADGQSRRELLR
jgi:hypothetical protein